MMQQRLHRFSLLLYAITLAMTACTASSSPSDATRDRTEGRAAGETPLPFTDVVYGNNYRKHVHLQSFRNKTYITLSATPRDEPYIWSLDHETGEWAGPVQVGHNQLPPLDQHGNPSMVIDNEGYIHVWYGSHGRHRTSERVYARSKRPEDISEWIHPDFETDITYPMASVMSDGAIHVLYRAGNHSMPGSDAWVIRKSSDNGETWSKPRVVVQKMPRNGTSDVYAVPAKYPGEDKIGIGVSDEYLPGSPTRHSTSHLFYVVYNAAKDRLENVQGRPLDAPEGADIETLREHCLIADYDALGNYNKRVSARPLFDEQGRLEVRAPNGDPAGFEPRPEDFDRDHKLKVYPRRGGKGGGIGHPPNYGKLTYGGKPRTWVWDGETWQPRDDADHPQPPSALNRARAQLAEHSDHHVYTLANTGHRPPHPDAQAVFYERSTDGDERAWLWGESGFLAPPEPLSKARVPLPIGLDMLAHEVSIEPGDAPGVPGTFAVPIENTLDEPLTVRLKASSDHGQGWRLNLPAPPTTLGPGESRKLDFTAKAQSGQPRYPLPQLMVQLAATTSGSGQRQRTVTRDLPVLGDQPRLELSKADSAPTVDGQLAEAPWQQSPTVVGFGRMDGARKTGPRTKAWLTYDANALYAAFRCNEPNMDQLKLDATKLDANVFQDDSVEVMIEPDGDGEGRNYRHVIVSAAGVLYDAKGFDNSVTLEGLEAATSHGESGWTAEITIPWAGLGLVDPPEQAGLLLARNRHAGGEHEIFQFPLSPNGNHQPAMFAELRLLSKEFSP